MNCFTREYRPPEIILGEHNYTEKAEVWSVGCIIAEIFQRTQDDILQHGQIFPGDSCYPLSPKPSGQSSISTSQDSNIHVSDQDQLLVIARSLGPSAMDSSFVGDSFYKGYLNQLIMTLNKCKSHTSYQQFLQTTHPEYKRFIERTLVFNPNKREEI